MPKIVPGNKLTLAEFTFESMTQAQNGTAVSNIPGLTISPDGIAIGMDVDINQQVLIYDSTSWSKKRWVALDGPFYGNATLKYTVARTTSSVYNWIFVNGVAEQIEKPDSTQEEWLLVQVAPAGTEDWETIRVGTVNEISPLGNHE